MKGSEQIKRLMYVQFTSRVHGVHHSYFHCMQQVIGHNFGRVFRTLSKIYNGTAFIKKLHQRSFSCFLGLVSRSQNPSS